MDNLLPITDEISIYDPELLVEKAQGNLIWFANNPEPYFDLIMGYSSTNFGHCNPIIMQSVKEAAEKFDNIPAFNTAERNKLSAKLLKHLPFKSNDYQVYYTVGGAKAVDASLKLARLFTEKRGVISFGGAFHGFISGLVGATDKDFLNNNYTALQDGNFYRLPFPDLNKGPEFSKVISQLEQLLEQEKNNIGTLIIEPVQGASGFRQADKEFFNQLQEVSRRYGIIIIADEIQMGLGRTGRFYSFEKYSFEPDIVILSKSLAGGYYPLSAIIARREYFDKIGADKSGFDSTFSNNAFGLYIANKVVDMIEEQDILKTVLSQSENFSNKISDIKNRFDLINNISMIGLACGIEITSSAIASSIKKEAFNNKLIIQTAGTDGNYLKIALSLLISDKEMDQSLELFGKVLENVKQNIGAKQLIRA